MASRLHQLRDEAGTSIVEVVVAAVILIIAAGAVASLVDAAQRDSGQQRIQAVATDVGQAQMEELRTLRFDDLIDLDDTEDISAGGVQFTVRRRSNWAMTADPGAVGCSMNSRNPEALRVVTTVTWPQMRRRPVTLESLVAAPTGGGTRRGGFTVQVGDRDGFGVANLAITMTGPATMTGSTDGSGCVRFNDLPAGAYSVTGGRGGWLQPDGATSLQRDVTVVTGTTATTSFEYDAGGTGLVRFIRGDSGAPPVAASMAGAIFEGAGMSASVPAGATRRATFDSPLLYPATAQYAVRPDVCPAARPAGGGVAVPRGGTSARVDLRVPVLNVSVAASDRERSTIGARMSSPCGTLFDTPTTTRNAKGNPTFTLGAAVPGGTLPWVCAWERATDPTPDVWEWKRALNVPLNTDTTGTVTINMSTGTTTAVSDATPPNLCQ